MNASSLKFIELRFLVHRDFVSKVIGQNNSNIIKLVKEYPIKINFSGKYTFERILTLSGFEAGALHSVLEKLLSLNNNDPDCSINWLLDQAQVDHLTSQSIEQLDDILESSSTLIDVYVLNCPSSSERVIKVKGKPNNISQCIYSLYQLLQWSLIKTGNKPYDSDNAIETLATDYGGFSKDMALKAAHPRTKNDPGSWESYRSIDLYSEQLNAVKLLIQSQNIPTSYYRKESGSNTSCKEFELPLHLLPLVTGERGLRMENICEESNVSVELKFDERSLKCCFTICGSPEEIENARELMKLCIQILGKRVDLPTIS